MNLIQPSREKQPYLSILGVVEHDEDGPYVRISFDGVGVDNKPADIKLRQSDKLELKYDLLIKEIF